MEVVAAAGAHASLSGLVFADVTLDAAALDAVVDAALARRVTQLELCFCALGVFAVPALVRLLQGSAALSQLFVGNRGIQLLDAVGAELMATALRINSTLTSLELFACEFFREPAAATTLLRALRGHRSLRCLDLAWNNTEDDHTAALAGAELAALLEADAPALHELNVSGWRLGARGLRPLCEALRRNTHLRVLDCGYNGMTEDFIRGCLLPALAANSSLRKLSLMLEDQAPTEAAAEAVAFVERRRADAEAAGEVQ